MIAPAAFADEAPPPDAKAVVTAQIQAFEMGDATRAWTLAAPQIREKFDSASEFIGMVKKNYGPIYRHRSIDFGPAARKGDEVGMVVTIVDDDNEVWSALFTLAKQPDGQWKTSGCLLTKAAQSSI